MRVIRFTHIVVPLCILCICHAVKVANRDSSTSTQLSHFYLADVLSEFERVLLTREGEISVERTSTSNLRRELSRVRRDFIVSTSNRSAQQSALLGSRKKGNSSQIWHCADGDRLPKAWTPGVLPHSSGGLNELSRVEHIALQGAREMVSLNDVFMTKTKADTSTNENGRRGSGFNDATTQVTGKQACRQAPQSSPPGAPGRAVATGYFMGSWKRICENNTFLGSLCWNQRPP